MAVKDVANDLSTMLVSIMGRLNATLGKTFIICLLTCQEEHEDIEYVYDD